MKKLIVIGIVVVLVAALFAGCSAGAVKTGLGQVISIAKSKDATADAAGVAQVDVTEAAVSIDSNGKILSVTIDSVQAKVAFDNAGKISTDKSAPQKSKVEIGDEYGMIKVSTIGKNWDEQIIDLEKWMIGKTIDEIKNMKVKKVDENHTNVPDEPDLTSKVTITVESYIAAVEEAVKNAK